LVDANKLLDGFFVFPLCILASLGRFHGFISCKELR
jgi:hypothetical protein